MKALQKTGLLLACILLSHLFIATTLPAQFVVDTALSHRMPAQETSALAWGDFDGDMDLDLLMAGEFQTWVLRNDTGTFALAQALCTYEAACDAAWADYDRDGDLDILVYLCEANQGAEPRLFRNDAGTFVEQLQHGLPPLRHARLDWGDYDNDGDADLILVGKINGIQYTKLMRNDGGHFVEQPTSLPAHRNTQPLWGDLDGDADLDLLLLDQEYGASLTTIYRNDAGVFDSVLDTLDRFWWAAEAALGDYDNDGDLDIAVTAGDPGGNGSTRIYRNDQGDFIRLYAVGLGNPRGGWLAWGDYDNDGDLDLLELGKAVSDSAHTRVYQNLGGQFVAMNYHLKGLENGRAAWGDYDLDGDLDIAMAGSASDPVARYYRNDNLLANSPPNAPTNLASYPAGDSAIHFIWDPATDVETPTDGLSYHLWIGTSPNSLDISPALADTATGWRRVAVRGDLQTQQWTLESVIPGLTYYACVSAIDGGWMGSDCSSSTSMLAIARAGRFPMTVFAGPNPTAGDIHISVPPTASYPVQYTLVNASGIPLPSHQGQFSHALDLDLSPFPAGVYFLQLHSPDFTQIEHLRIVKQ